MAKRQPPAIEEDEGPSKAWMESYADAMTLLLAFFIMMFAFALVDETKFYDFKVGMVAALGAPSPFGENTSSILGDGAGIAITLGDNFVPAENVASANAMTKDDLAEVGTVTADNAEQVKELIQREYDRLGASDYVNVEIDERGVVIRFDSRILFASGSADFGPDADLVLDATADVLSTVDNPVDVEGHTDNVPLNSFARYPTNWELSGARASSVVRYLLAAQPLAPSRMAAVGMADTRPRESNDTADGRTTNRRVEVVLRIEQFNGSSVDLVEPIDLFAENNSRQEPDNTDSGDSADTGASGQS